ncbi:hypothetical protein BOI36_19255 [Salmonella enterica subsp. enterica serovar O rough]|nr:hypothetical protein [Salmonella enterica subsp. enterica serovar O rough]
MNISKSGNYTNLCTGSQTQRLMNRFREFGAAGLSSLRRGRPGKNRIGRVRPQTLSSAGLASLFHNLWHSLLHPQLAIPYIKSIRFVRFEAHLYLPAPVCRARPQDPVHGVSIILTCQNILSLRSDEHY